MSAHSITGAILVLILATPFYCAAEEKEGLLEGTWVLHQFTVDGQELDLRITLSFAGETATCVLHDLNDAPKGKVRTWPKKQPAEINFDYGIGPDPLWRGIYTCRNGELRMWFFTNGIGRPTKRDVRNKVGINEAVFRREDRKKKADEPGK